MTDRQQALVAAIRAAVDGRMATWTKGQLFAVEAAVTDATERDLAAAAERILVDALDQVILQRLHPSKREPPKPRRTAQGER